MAVQEAKLAVAMNDLNVAQAQLDEKNRELAEVMALYDAAMTEKQVKLILTSVGLLMLKPFVVLIRNR